MKTQILLQWAIFYLVLCAGLISPSIGKVVVTDKDWISAGQAKGTDREIKSIAVDGQGNLFASGWFSNAGGVMANFYTAQWDGAAWNSPWSSLVATDDGDTSAFSYSWESFTVLAGDNNERYLAGTGVFRLVGTIWHNMLKDFEGNVSAAIFHKGILYAGGIFWRSEDGTSLPSVMKWDGSSWMALAEGIRIDSSDQCIHAFAVDSFGNLFAGGKFTRAGKVSANNIVKWNGSSWSALGKGVAFTVYAMAIDHSGNLFVGGYDDVYENGNYTFIKNISQWNGTSWKSIESSTGGEINALLYDKKGDMYVAGSFDSIGNSAIRNCAKWNGETWSALGAGVDGSINALVEGKNGELYAAGGIASAGGYLAGNIAQWNGSEWSTLGSGVGLNGPVDVLAIDTFGTIYEGYHSDESLRGPNVACREKNGWMPLGRGVGSDGVWAIAPDNRGGAYVGGSIAPYGTPFGGLARWDGSKWIGMGPNNTHRIKSVTLDKNGNLFVGGQFEVSGNASSDTLGHGSVRGNIGWWNGASWNSLGKGLNGIPTALAADGHGALYAGGGFDSAGGLRASRIAKWDGSAWSSLGSGVQSTDAFNAISAIVFDKEGNLYISGDFDSAGGQPAAKVAKWDGATWSPLGKGLRGGNGSWRTIGKFVHSLVFDSDGNLYAGGTFDSAGEGAARNIARWDGVQWTPIGSGCNGSVTAMVIDKNGVLHAGGAFDTAGGQFSPYYAMCKLSAPHAASTRLPAAAPAIKAGNGRILIRLVATAEVSVRMMTLSGREIFRSCKMMPAGEHAVGLSMRDLARGAYVIQVNFGNELKRLRLFIDR